MTTRARRRPVILVFGENDNDTRAIRHLIRAIHPSLDKSLDIKAMKKPISLQRTAGRVAVQDWLQRIAASARGELGDVHAIVVHRDSDRPDPNGEERLRLLEQLSSGLKGFHHIAVVPVQEMESWWFLFPDAVRSVNPQAWRSLNWRSHDPETRADAKKDLQNLTGKTGRKYHESDSIAVAENVFRHNSQPQHPCASWKRFESDVMSMRTR